MHLPGARPQPIAAGQSGFVVVNGASLLRGWSFQESTGSASASLQLLDGDGTTGLLVCAITLTANQSTRDWLSDSGIEIRNALYYVVTAGSVLGSLWVSPGEFVNDFVIVKGPIPVP